MHRLAVLRLALLAAALLWSGAAGQSGNVPAVDDDEFAACQAYLSSIQARSHDCYDKLGHQASERAELDDSPSLDEHSDEDHDDDDQDHRGCPPSCYGLFTQMSPSCAAIIAPALPPSISESIRAGGTLDLCGALCGSDPASEDCRVTRDVLPGLGFLDWLDEPSSPGWDLLRGNGSQALAYSLLLEAQRAQQQGSASGGSSSSSGGGSSVDVGTLIGAIVGGTVALVAAMAVAFVLLRRRRRHVRRTEEVPGRQAASSQPASGAGGGDVEHGLQLGGAASPTKPLSLSGGPDGGGKQLDTLQTASSSTSDGLEDVAALWAGAASAAGLATGSPGDSAFSSGELQRVGSGMQAADAQALAEDPLLTCVNQRLLREASVHSEGSAAASAGSALGLTGRPSSLRSVRSTASRGTSNGLDLRHWEVQYSDLTIMRPLGEGSFGRVYLASRSETLCAVKMLLPGDGEERAAMSPSSPVMQALHQECGLMASLRHPNVVLFLGVCYQPPAIVTEFCSRGSLHDVLRGAAHSEQAASVLTWPRRLNIALDAAKGMLCLHTHSPPILHRDLKSPNLLVDAAWRCKVADFNLSRLLEDTGATRSSASTTGGLLNPRWLAPEVLTGGSATAASDVFSFGVVLWELLTWKLPWMDEGLNAFRLVFAVSGGQRLVVPPREELPGPQPPEPLYEAYVALLQRCWAQQPEDRPAFGDVIAELRELMARTVAATNDKSLSPQGSLTAAAPTPVAVKR